MNFITGDVRWGIIGCGDVCEVKSGPAFSKVDNSSLQVVMRRDLEKAKDYAHRHHVPKFYSDAGDLINDPDVNAVYIATPPAQHEEYAVQSMAAGKPVYIEKPLALNSESAIRIKEASLKYNVRATGAYYRRELALFRKVRSLLNENAIGEVKVILLRTLQSSAKNIITQTPDNWRVNPTISGGGLFHDLAPHQLDLMYYFFGKPSELDARSLTQEKNSLVPNLTSFDALFPNDVLFKGIWAFNVDERAVTDSCEIIGDRGMLSFSFFSGARLEIKSEKSTEVLEFINPPHVQQPMIEKVVKYFKGEGENPCSVDDALMSMRMLDAANR